VRLKSPSAPSNPPDPIPPPSLADPRTARLRFDAPIAVKQFKAPARIIVRFRLKHRPQRISALGELTRAFIMLHSTAPLLPPAERSITERSQQNSSPFGTHCGHSKTSPRPSVPYEMQSLHRSSGCRRAALLGGVKTSRRSFQQLPVSTFFLSHCQRRFAANDVSSNSFPQIATACASIPSDVWIPDRMAAFASRHSVRL